MSSNIPVLEEFKEDKITTIVADDLEIKGTIKFKTSVMLKGVFEGEIISEGLLVVGPTAKVAATITTKTLISYGEINGDITAYLQCVLKSTAVHNGDIKAPFLSIESGAFFNGAAVMERNNTEERAMDLVQAPQIPEEGLSADDEPDKTAGVFVIDRGKKHGNSDTTVEGIDSTEGTMILDEEENDN